MLLKLKRYDIALMLGMAGFALECVIATMALVPLSLFARSLGLFVDDAVTPALLVVAGLLGTR